MKKDKPAVLLEHYLKRLKLPTFLRERENRARQRPTLVRRPEPPGMAVVCREEKADYQTYLLRLAELESIDRERRSAERRIRAAPGASAPDSGPATSLPGSSRS